jgi:electron transport complex protein RnfA
MIYLIALAVFSGLSLNILLQFAVGTVGAASDNVHKKWAGKNLPFIQLGILFFSVLFFWIFFKYILPVNWRGFSEYFLFFPLSALTCMGLERLAGMIFPRIFPLVFPRIFPPFAGIKKVFSSFTAYDGLVPASLIITFFVAEDFAGAFVLTLFFAIGNMTAMLILNEIRRKSVLEWVPRYLRGTPLILVSMGLLSLISASAAGICFRMLEVFLCSKG